MQDCVKLSTKEKFFGNDLKVLRKKNVNRIVTVHPNINSILNKFDVFLEGVKSQCWCFGYF